MLNQHIEEDLSAYCHGEFAPHEARRVAEHLMGCETCRGAYEEVRAGIGHLSALPVVAAPDDLWSAIESGLDAAVAVREDRAEVASRPVLARRVWPRYAAVAAMVLVAACAGLAWYALRTPVSTWAVRSISGAPTVGTSRIGERGDLAVGQTLETDAASCAEIRIGAIGTVEVEPNSRVRLVGADLSNHRLALDRGTMHARIWAPPRLFFVDTPSGEAIDYGCAYTLAVDDAGTTTLRVTHGWVALARDGAESLVPEGAECSMRKGIGPGTPYFDDASAPFREALAALDFDGGGEPALATVLAESRRRDALTLWHLLAKVAGADRARVFDRLAAFVPPPEGVTRERALALEPSALETWRKALRATWVE